MLGGTKEDADQWVKRPSPNGAGKLFFRFQYDPFRPRFESVDYQEDFVRLAEEVSKGDKCRLCEEFMRGGSPVVEEEVADGDDDGDPSKVLVYNKERFV